MTFQSDKVNDFLEIFDASKTLIRNSEGCTHLELLNDINSSNIFFTYSYWRDEEALNTYRNSELFITVWSKTKVLFSEKPEAWSLQAV